MAVSKYSPWARRGSIRNCGRFSNADRAFPASAKFRKSLRLQIRNMRARSSLIHNARNARTDLHGAKEETVRMNDLKKLIREVPDYPKPGILFYDITTLLKDKNGFHMLVDRLCDHESCPEARRYRRRRRLRCRAYFPQRP